MLEQHPIKRRAQQSERPEGIDGECRPGSSDSPAGVAGPVQKMARLDVEDFRRDLARWTLESRGEVAVALFAVEFDDFILITDVLGDDVGQTLITHGTRCLEYNERYHGMFTVVSPGRILIAFANIEETEHIWDISRTLQQVFAQPARSEIGTINLQPLIGISLYPHIAHDAAALESTAVTALALAKRDSRDNIHLYDSVMAEQSKQTLIRLFELKNALCDGCGIETFYQPKQALSDDRIIGLEALVRWRHPRDGLLSPAAFIELAEEKGVICQITDLVIETVCRDFHYFRRQGFTGVISVNVSAKDFDRADFVTQLCSTLQKYGVSPGDIELEITETAFILDFNRCYLVLSALREKGFNLTIDDFGKGYSSLSYLKKLPVDTIKVDKEFIRNIEHSSVVQSVFEALLKIAHTQDLKVVAEGVESEEQKHILRRMRCDHIQGYLLSKPRPVADFPAMGLWDSPGEQALS